MPHTYTDIPAAGTRLQMMISAAYVDIPGASEVTWDGYKRAVRNPTYLLSRAVAKKPGMPDFGQIKCKVFFDPNDTTHQLIRNRLLESATTAYADHDQFQIVYADGFTTPAHAEVLGFVSEFGEASGEAESGTFTADLTIEVADIIAFTAGV